MDYNFHQIAVLAICLGLFNIYVAGRPQDESTDVDEALGELAAAVQNVDPEQITALLQGKSSAEIADLVQSIGIAPEQVADTTLTTNLEQIAALVQSEALERVLAAPIQNASVPEKIADVVNASVLDHLTAALDSNAVPEQIAALVQSEALEHELAAPAQNASVPEKIADVVNASVFDHLTAALDSSAIPEQSKVMARNATLENDTFTTPRPPTRQEKLARVSGTINRLLPYFTGSVQKGGDPCNPKVEEKISYAIVVIDSNDTNGDEAVSSLLESEKLFLEGRRVNPKLTICNRSKLALCDDDTKKCTCIESTAQREIQKFKLKSGYCYSFIGNCTEDATDFLPTFDQQKEMIWRHYGNPKTDLVRGCLQNLCFLLIENEKTCSDEWPYD